MLDASYLTQLPNRVEREYAGLEKSLTDEIAISLSRYKIGLSMPEYLSNEINRIVDKSTGVMRKGTDTIELEMSNSMLYGAKEYYQSEMRAYNFGFERGFVTSEGHRALEPQNYNGVVNKAIDNTSKALDYENKQAPSNASQIFTQYAEEIHAQTLSGANEEQTKSRVISKMAGIGIVAIIGAKRYGMGSLARAGMTSNFNRMTGEMTDYSMSVTGANLVLVTWHSGARPTHAVWQGKVYWWKFAVEGYAPLVESTDYGAVDGLKGINCYHDFGVYFEGMDKASQNKIDLVNAKTVNYRGEKMSYYDALQREREIERNYMAWERRASALQAAGMDATKAVAKAEEWKRASISFSKSINIHRNIYFGGEK